MVFCRRNIGHIGRLHPTSGLDSPISYVHVTHAARMIQRLGWWGGITVQTKEDSRDNTPKLMEINPRLGQGLWFRTEIGINEPLMILKIARGEEFEPIQEYPVGTIFADPVEDTVRLGLALMDLLIYRFRIGFLGKEPIDRSNPEISLRELIQSLRQTYFSGGNRTSSL